MNLKLALIGSGSLGQQIKAELADQDRESELFDITEVEGQYTYTSVDEKSTVLDSGQYKVVICVGGAVQRAKIFDDLVLKGFEFGSVVLSEP